MENMPKLGTAQFVSSENNRMNVCSKEITRI